MSKIRTRFAPSPTGYMHIGNLRTALYCYLIAKHQGGDFILRIEDTDQNREVKGATDVIFNTLKETGLNWDEGPDKPGDVGPYIQSERLGIYKDYANKLIQVGAAHYCFCNKDEKDTEGFEMRDPCRYLSKEEVQAKLDAGEEYVIRQTIPEEGVASFDDEIYGHIEAPVDTLDDAVLLKSDGFPTYNFANVVDDHLMGITDVVRGNEYLSSTPKYNLLYKAFNWNPPRYIHLPPVMKDEHSKLSKRNGDASFQDLKAEGYLPQAILNYIALLGWAPADEEILSLDDLIQQFTVDRISKAPAIFDKDKLTWVNETYLRNMTLDDFHNLVSPLYKDALTRKVDKKEISMVLQPRLTRINLDEVKGFVDFINECLPFDAALYKHKKMKTNPYNSLEALKLSLPAMEAWEDYSDDDGMMHMQMDIAKEHELKNGRIMWPIRVALSNKAMTPGGSVEIAHILGKEETLKRMRQAIADLEAWVEENPEA